MGVDGRGPRHRQAQIATHAGGLGVEIVEHLDVIADETDGADHGGRETARRFLPEVVADIGTEPGILGSAAKRGCPWQGPPR